MKKKIILVIFVFVLVAISFSGSFSYIGTKVVDGISTESNMKTGSLNIKINDNKLTGVDLVPIYDKNYETSAYKKDFEIESKSTLNACTNIYLNMTSMSESLKSKYLKYKLITNDKTYEGNFSNAVINENLLLANDIFIEQNTTTKYKLYIWISYDEEEDQSSLLGTSFSAKVVVKSYDSQTRDGCVR